MFVGISENQLHGRLKNSLTDEFLFKVEKNEISLVSWETPINKQQVFILKQIIHLSLLSMVLLYNEGLTQPGDKLGGQLINNMFPLNADDIQNAKGEIKVRQKAAAVMPAMTDIQGVSRVVMANTKPGFVTSPPNVRLGIGVVTSVIFTTTKGEVWPITSYVVGNTEDFSVSWNNKSGIVMLQSMKPYANTNLAVMLQGRSTPITLMLQSTQKQWDYELYVRVTNTDDDRHAENIKQSSYLLSLLSGIVPDGARPLAASGGEGGSKFWHYQNRYLILTSGTLISPAYINHIENNTLGTTNVYEIKPTPVVIISDKSGIHKLNLKDE